MKFVYTILLVIGFSILVLAIFASYRRQLTYNAVPFSEIYTYRGYAYPMNDLKIRVEASVHCPQLWRDKEGSIRYCQEHTDDKGNIVAECPNFAGIDFEKGLLHCKRTNFVYQPPK